LASLVRPIYALEPGKFSERDAYAATSGVVSGFFGGTGTSAVIVFAPP